MVGEHLATSVRSSLCVSKYIYLVSFASSCFCLGFLWTNATPLASTLRHACIILTITYALGTCLSGLQILTVINCKKTKPSNMVRKLD